MDSGLSLKELAEQVKLSDSTLSRYEQGLYIANHPTTVLLAQKLGVNPVWLLGYPGAVKFLSKLADDNVTQVPILSHIKSGRAVVVRELVEGYEYAPNSAGVDFCLIVKDDHMINARLFNGDVVCVSRQTTVKSGDIAVVILPNEKEAVIRRVYKIDGNLILRSENPKYPDEIFGGRKKGDVQIIGKVVYLRAEVR